MAAAAGRLPASVGGDPERGDGNGFRCFFLPFIFSTSFDVDRAYAHYGLISKPFITTGPDGRTDGRVARWIPFQFNAHYAYADPRKLSGVFVCVGGGGRKSVGRTDGDFNKHADATETDECIHRRADDDREKARIKLMAPVTPVVSPPLPRRKVFLRFARN